MYKAIVNARVVMPTEIINDGIIIIKDKSISDITKNLNDIPENATIIDAENRYVGPGFVDIHVHGGGNFASYDESGAAADYFLKFGTTTMLATTVYTQSLNELLNSIRSAKKAMKKNSVIKGIYMEGPYINCKYGANADKNPWQNRVKYEDYKALVDECADAVKVWVTAPELEGIGGLYSYAKEINPNVVFSIGHSQAGYEHITSHSQVEFKNMTHIMNATGRAERPKGTRGYGPDEFCLANPKMYAELISDSLGLHVCPALQKMIFNIKGAEKIVLITDSTIADSPSPEKYSHITDLNFDHNGDLHGSRLTMNAACRNIMSHTNCSISDAFKMASLNPSKVIGLDKEIGSVEKGKIADLVFVDEDFNVHKVISQGEIYE